MNSSFEAVPPKFDTLDTVLASKDGTFANVIGVVIDMMPPAQSRGSDWTMRATLQDRTATLSVRWFCRNQNQLPPEIAVGDVIMLKNIKRSTFKGEKHAITNYQTSTRVFKRASIADPKYAIAYVNQGLPNKSSGNDSETPTANQNYYIIGLKQWAQSSSGPVQDVQMSVAPTVSRAVGSAQPAAASRPTNKFKLIQNLNMDTFSDVVVEVVKIFQKNFQNMEVYVSDYTENTLLFDYPYPDQNTTSDTLEHTPGDQYSYITAPDAHHKGWKGPFGRMTLQITVWPPHSEWASANLTEGALVLIKNIHAKYLATGANQVLAGALHSDRKYPDQVDISRVRSEDPRVVALLDRKAQYQDASQKKLDPGPKKSKNKKKSRKNKGKKPSDQTEKDPIPDGVQSTPKQGETPPEPVQEISDAMSCANLHENLVSVQESVNGLIKIKGKDWPLLSIKHFLDINRTVTHNGQSRELQYINQKAHCRVRVRNYASSDHTADIRNFARQTASGQWTWFFWLKLQDSSFPISSQEHILTVNVQHENAEFLLNMKACDFKKFPKRVELLRKKLKVLWGDLEAVKKRGAQAAMEYAAQPFDCVLAEYGMTHAQKADGSKDWSQAQRAYALMDTAIQG